MWKDDRNITYRINNATIYCHIVPHRNEITYRYTAFMPNIMDSPSSPLNKFDVIETLIVL